VLVAPLLVLGAFAVRAQAPVTVGVRAPEIVGGRWINASAPISLKSRQGKVTVVEFFTSDCINCRHNLPAYEQWSREFAPEGVEVIGIHTPETKWESGLSFVRMRVRQYGITYPVVTDNDSVNWTRWNNEFWPTVYLVDKKGVIRYRWDGELNWDNAGGTVQMTALIEKLLKEPA
jgi:thiol-disulfide isomerase/thioredoxin